MMELVRYNGDKVYSNDIRVDNLQNLYWRTAEGQLIAVPKLENHHLRNIALMLMGFGYQEFLQPDELKILWLRALRMEWERRKPSFASKAEYRAAVQAYENTVRKQRRIE